MRFHLAAMEVATPRRGRGRPTRETQVMGLAGEYLAVVAEAGAARPAAGLGEILSALLAFAALYRVRRTGGSAGPSSTARGAAARRVYDGKPFAAVVSIEGLERPVFSDADGNFRIEVVPALRRAVARATRRAARPGVGTVRREGEPSENIEIHLKDPGKVWHRRDAQDAAGRRVRRWSRAGPSGDCGRGGAWSSGGTSSPDGAFRSRPRRSAYQSAIAEGYLPTKTVTVQPEIGGACCPARPTEGPRAVAAGRSCPRRERLSELRGEDRRVRRRLRAGAREPDDAHRRRGRFVLKDSSTAAPALGVGAGLRRRTQMQTTTDVGGCSR